ncbi:putative ribonuclease H-like domain-containing protein [Tanacetum coccineum]
MGFLPNSSQMNTTVLPATKESNTKASYKAITAVSTPPFLSTLQLLHMDFLGTLLSEALITSTILVGTDDLEFSWVFFLGTKDETFYILRDFITFVENQLTKKVKAIRCGQWEQRLLRKNRTLIEAARTMLADSKLPTMFWTEAVSTACYVLNRVLVTRPHNKTPYELLSGKVPNISHLKPFGCHVTILNTSDHLGKFEGKADEGFLVGYSAHSKAYRVYNLSNKKIEETLNLRYMEDKPNVQGLGHEWYFDLDYLTDSLGYTRFKSNQPAGTQDTNTHAGTHDDSDSECDEQVIVVPSFPSNHFSGPKVHTASATVESTSDYAEELARLQGQAYEANSAAKDTWKIADTVPAGSGVPATSIPAGSINQAAGGSAVPSTPSSSVVEPVHADDYTTSSGHSPSSYYLAFSSVYNMMLTLVGSITNFSTYLAVDPVPTRRVHLFHPISQIMGYYSPVLAKGHFETIQVWRIVRLAGYVHDQPKETIHRTISLSYDKRRMHQFFNQVVWKLLPLPEGKVLLGTKWILRIKECQRSKVMQQLMGFLSNKTSMSRHASPPRFDMESIYDSEEIFKYLKANQHLVYGTQEILPLCWEVYSDSDYAVPNGVRKSHGGCQFSWGGSLTPNPQNSDHAAVQIHVHQTASTHDHGSPSPRPSPTSPAAQLNKPVSKPSRPIPTSPSAQVNQQGPSSDPLSTAAPPEGTTSGGAEDLLNLTALYTLVSEQGKKIGSLESELQAHKLLFKDVMGKLVKRVKFLESKLKARGRNVIFSDSDKEEDEEQDVDSLIKLAMAAATAADTSSVPADATQATEFPPSSSIHTDAFVHGNAVPTGTASDFSADPSNKGKSPMVEEDPPIKERSFRQMEEDRLGAEAARKLYEEEQAELARVQGTDKMRKGKRNVINSASIYTDGLIEGWLPLLLERRRKFDAQSCRRKKIKANDFCTTNGLYANFECAADLQAQKPRRSLKRPGADVEQPGSKKSKSSAAPQTPVPAASHQSSAGVTTNVHPSPFVDSPLSTPAVTPDTSVDPPVAPTPSFVTPVSRSSGPRDMKVISPAGFQTYSTRSEVSSNKEMSSSAWDLNDPDESPFKLFPTGLGDVNALYFTNKSSKYFTHLREILHLLDRQDLSKLYGMVVKHYDVNPLAGPNRLASPRVNGYLVKASSNPFTFYDSPLPGVNTPWDVMRIVCNPELMDVAEVVQSWYVVPTGRVIATVSIKVPTGRYIVPAGYIISPGLKDLSRAETYKWYQSLERVSVEE